MSELLSAAHGRKVLSRDDAEDVGDVKTAVFDDRVQRIVALHVSGGRRKAQLVAWEDVVGFGPDAVVITSAERLREAHDDESAAVRRKINPIGALVIDDHGDQHGVVNDIRFDPESGSVEAIIGDDADWRPSEVCALGSFGLVVRHR
ncbi:MAG: PRC-barrel domain-containing protein [Acidimicrobiales bacterium]